MIFRNATLFFFSYDLSFKVKRKTFSLKNFHAITSIKVKEKNQCKVYNLTLH